MTFRDLFEEMHRKDPLISGGALAGSDGLAVEEWKAATGDRDLGALCAEMAQFFKESGRISVETGMYLVVPWVVPLVSARKGIRPGQVRFSNTG